MKYEYMKEYTINGYRPEGLADDVEVECYTNPYDKWRGADIVANWFWSTVKKFRIVDERFKPSSDTDVGSNWYELGERPPVGEMINYDGEQFEILAYRHWEGELLAVLYSHLHGFAKHVEAKPEAFRPIPTERDKLIERANSDFMHAKVGSYTSYERKCIEALIDANWRPIKQQTEEEFASEACSALGEFKAPYASALYRADCRFIDPEV